MKSMLDDHQLLRRYAADGSEAAFGELVERYVNLVYSAAHRRTGGDTHLAQDVAQLVFTDLARKAGSLHQRVVLAGWLHRATQYAAAQLLRTEHRRQAREQEAMAMNIPNSEPVADWEQIHPLLDEALDRLSPADRDALLLRFFEQQSLANVGQALGSNEDAARKRVTRALEKLRTELVRRGVTSTAAALSVAISVNAAQAAPTGLAATLTSASLASAAAGTSTTLTLIKLITMTKLHTAVLGAIVVVVVTTPLVIYQQAQVRALTSETAVLRRRADQLSPLIAATERFSNLVAQAEQAQPSPTEPSGELLRLRGEVTRLRSVAQELAQLQAAEAQRANNPVEAASQNLLAKVKFLKQRLEQNPNGKIPELRYLSGNDWLRLTQEARLRDENPSDDQVLYALATVRSSAKQQLAYWMQPALRDYAQANGGQLPTEVNQLKPYFNFNCPADDATLDRYQMLKTGNVNDLTAGALVIGEKAPVDDQYDTLWQIGMTNFVWQGTGKYRALMHGGWPAH
jgi:RNA polymerase sigma factor (sigma-70 family)